MRGDNCPLVYHKETVTFKVYIWPQGGDGDDPVINGDREIEQLCSF